MVKKPLWTLFFVVLTLGPLGASDGLSVSIRFQNKEIYTPETPVNLLVSVKNTSADTQWFAMPNNPVFAVELQVKSMQDGLREVAKSETFRENRFNNQPVFFRDVTLRSGEEFSFSLALGDWYDPLKPGVYQIQVTYYPRLVKGFQGQGGGDSRLSVMAEVHNQGHETAFADRVNLDTQGLGSNTLALSVRPSVSVSTFSASAAHQSPQTGEILSDEKLSPDEVVDFVLQARQQDHEAKFFHYLDIEELYKRDPGYKRAYLQAAPHDRELMLKDYHQVLWLEETALSKKPAGFEILSTGYSGSEAQVKARLRFDQGDYFEVKDYTYAMKKSGKAWKIYDFRVVNRQAESRRSSEGVKTPQAGGH